ncbi:MAG: hypothetical protein FWD76_05460, partial [Firmicutes bacterium]|nr:hypothetical protein [Bacillota bacterium]
MLGIADGIKVNNQPIKGMWVDNYGIKDMWVTDNNTGIKKQVVQTREPYDKLDDTVTDYWEEPISDEPYVWRHRTSKPYLSCRSIKGTFSNFGMDASKAKLEERFRIALNNQVYIYIKTTLGNYDMVEWSAHIKCGEATTGTAGIFLG